MIARDRHEMVEALARLRARVVGSEVDFDLWLAELGTGWVREVATWSR